MTTKPSPSKRVIPWLVAAALSLAACSSPEERAQAHYASGMELIAAGEFAKAGLEFRNAIKYNEKLASAWFGLATVEEQKQNWPLVADSLQRVVELDKTNSDALLKLAKLQFAAIKLDEALKSINAANAIKRDDTAILALRAAILFRLGDREGARRDSEAALALNPDNPDAHAVLAADKMADGNGIAALRFIDRGLATDPNNLGLLLFKVKIFEDAKDDPKLEAVLRQIVAAHPAITEIRQALLQFLLTRNRMADVETELRAMVQADSKDTAKALALVRFVGTIRGAAAGRKELEKLIASQPAVTVYRFALARLDFSEKRSDAAISAVQAILDAGGAKEDVQNARLLLAEFKFRSGKKEEAAALIDQVLEIDAKNADALAIRAGMRLEADDSENAVADLREALNQQPQSVPFMILLARAHERQGAVELAEERFSQALKLSNYAPQVAMDYISLLQRRGKNDRVEETLNEAIARNPGNPVLLKNLAQIRLNRQDWAGAQEIAEALKKNGDKSEVGDLITGAALLGEKKYDQSIETLKSAYQATPKSAQPSNSLFLAYIQAGKLDEAEKFAQSLLAANASNALAHVMLGSIRQLEKKPGEAEAAFSKAIELQPDNPNGYTALAKHYLSSQQTAQAETVLKSAREKIPDDFGINLTLANALESRNDVEGAIAIYEHQIKLTPDALIIVNNLASLLADYRSDKESLERARIVSQRLKGIDVPQFKDTVGWISYQTGDFRTALLNLEAAAEKLPDLPIVKYHLALTYLALKRTADAKEQLAKADTLLKQGDPLKAKIAATVTNLTTAN